MLRFGQFVTKHRKFVLAAAVLLLIPSIIGIMRTRINYDVLSYLPDDIETVKGQDMLLEEFGKGGFAMVMVEGMEQKDVSGLKDEIEDIDNVDSVVWYDSIADSTMPMEILPSGIYDRFNSGDTTLMAVFFDRSTSSDESLDAVSEIRKAGGEQCFVSGMTAFVEDLKEIAEKEEPVYVGLAVLFCCIVLAVFMDSWIIPLIFIAGIGMSILYNLGTNIFIGEISYITKALSAVLQLGVTMDYSIFLWHSYEEKRNIPGMDKEDAMAHAVADTFVSVTGSSLTTVAGFLALCFMTFTLGRNLGLVMAKGVIFGVAGCLIILPALILTFEKLIDRTRHRSLMPDFRKVSEKVTARPGIFAAVFVILLIPAFYGYMNTDVYYNLDKSVPDTLPFHVANSKLAEEFDMNTTHMILVDSGMEDKDVRKMMNEIDEVDGVKYTLGRESLMGPAVPDSIVPGNVGDMVQSDDHKLFAVNSEYKVASDEINTQIDSINSIIKKYDKDGMLIGEAPCTKDLIDVTDRDFRIVSGISIAVIFLLIAIILKSVSLPVILVALIEFAIFINMGIPFYTGTELPFIASICIGTIQLGATVDYAILMTTRYRRERHAGKSSIESIRTAHSTSMPSVAVSALGFFAATCGVGIYSDIDIISSLCSLMARGAIVSMLVVMFLMPAMFVLSDRIICRTSRGFLPETGTYGKDNSGNREDE